MFKIFVLVKFFLAHVAIVYNIVRKMEGKEHKENQSSFSFNKKGNLIQNVNLEL